MEAWVFADKDALAEYFGAGFNRNALPPRRDIENIPKTDLENGLQQATLLCKKGQCRKGRHSFRILAELPPEKVTAASPHARRLVDALRKTC